MKCKKPLILIPVFTAFLILASPLSGVQAQPHKRIAAFGSSVCNGTGDHLQMGGYIGRYKDLMKKYGWEVINVSRGGDNTTTINDRWGKTEQTPVRPVQNDQYLLPRKPDYVIIGLSLNNEGLRTVPEEKQDSIFNKFKNGILAIAERCSKEGYKVAVANCYANQLFTERHYEQTKKMNIEINKFELPSINLLGSLDDGNGRWPEGFNYDDIHPSGGGHREMFFSIVPTLFDAVKAGRPIPKFSGSISYAEASGSEAPALTFSPADTVHSFAVSFLFRNDGSSTLATVTGHQAAAFPTEFKVKENTVKGIVFYTSKDAAKSTLSLRGDILEYASAAGEVISKRLSPAGDWHRLTISHRFAQGETLVFIDDKLAGKAAERIVPEQFQIAGRGKCGIKDVLIYRSSLNENEVSYLNKGGMIQSSLEVYSPLNEKTFTKGKSVKNLAQSMSELKVTGRLTAR